MPYSEGAALSLARNAQELHLASTVFASALPEGIDRAFRRLKPGRAPRRYYPASEIQEIVHVGGIAEAARLGLRLSHAPAAASSAFMYRSSESFDRRVSLSMHRLALDQAVVLGFPGACLDTMRAANRGGATSVLHMVNGHPRHNNRVLANQCGLPRNHHEMVPERIVGRVEGEIEAASLILAPSTLVRDQLIEFGTAEPKIRVIPYGVDTALFTETPALRLRGDRIRALFVGQISYRKGVHLLVEAARLSPTIAYHLVGPVVSKNILASLPSNVTHSKAASRAEVSKLMSAADVFVLPSVEDACALVIAEALAARCPVVTTFANGSCGLVVNGVSGYVLQTPEPDAIVQALGAAAELSVPPPPDGIDWSTYCDRVFEAILPQDSRT